MDPEEGDTSPLQNLSNRVKDLEDRVQNITGISCHDVTELTNLARHIANHVDSVIGMKEACNSRGMIMKMIWATLLVAGFGATIYYIQLNFKQYLSWETATRIKLVQNASYEYPPIVLCPPWWLSVGQALSSGLSMDALTYSLGYTSFYNDIGYEFMPTNGTSIKSSFLDYYHAKNFSNLGEYFKYISVDIADGPATSLDAINKTCKGCDESIPVEKFLLNKGICFIFNVNRVTASSATKPPRLELTNYKPQGHLFKNIPNYWYFDIQPNMQSNMPALLLKPFYQHTARLIVQHNIMMPSPDCVKTEIYDRKDCLRDCLTKENRLDGRLYDDWPKKQPHDAYNILDFLPFEDIMIESMNDTLISDSLISILENSTTAFANFTLMSNESIMELQRAEDGPPEQELVNCYEECKPRCDRMIYDITLERIPWARDDSPANQSTIILYLKHAAAFQGGIVTWEEIYTMSTTDLISNIGGTLGMFLGCTAMTLPQLMFSLINWATDMIKSRVRPKRKSGAIVVPVDSGHGRKESKFSGLKRRSTQYFKMTFLIKPKK